MRQFRITRAKKISARWITYYCIQNYDVSNFRRYLEHSGIPLSENAMNNISRSPYKIYESLPTSFDLEDFKAYLTNSHSGESFDFTITPLKSGETVAIEMDEGDNTVFAAAFTSAGVALSNQIIINDENVSNQFTIITKNNWKTGIDITIS